LAILTLFTTLWFLTIRLVFSPFVLEASIALELKLEAPRGGHRVFYFASVFRIGVFLGWGDSDSIARGVCNIS